MVLAPIRYVNGDGRGVAVSALLWVVLVATGAAAAPAVVERVEAEYPAWARGTGLSTRVALRVRVSAQGRAERIVVEPYSTRDDVLTRPLRASFDSAAIRAVRHWGFRPAMQAGRPVVGWIRVEVSLQEAWTRSADPHAVMPDSLRSSEHWNAVMGEWWRVPIRRTPVGHPSALQFQRGGWYLSRTAAGGERRGRFELSSNGSLDDPAAVLALVPDAGGGRRHYLIHFAARDTLILSPWRTAGVCDTFVATARGTGR